MRALRVAPSWCPLRGHRIDYILRPRRGVGDLQVTIITRDIDLNAGAMMLPALDMNGEHGSACEDALQQQLIRNRRADLLARFDDCDFRPLVDRKGRDLCRPAYDREERVHQR